MKEALILVDIQKDFLPGGALVVPEGDAIIPVVNELIPQFGLVLACKDWHPHDHGSFASQHPGKKPGDIIILNGLEQILWPDHCVMETPGAEFAQGLNTNGIHKIFPKGTDPAIDSYSAFFDNGHQQDTGLGPYLKEEGVEKVFIVGLATDYCVKFTALDAQGLGFKTTVIKQGVRGVELNPGDCDKAFQDMIHAGIDIISNR
ncbi:MAG: bifunctional nicotinamidase/pyrazinamidase [Deltaproteobacteria bacterium]|nr:bifunctional nicotinamidase/pyrazinamidase [Deltaproteobacteria bacterium]